MGAIVSGPSGPVKYSAPESSVSNESKQTTASHPVKSLFSVISSVTTVLGDPTDILEKQKIQEAIADFVVKQFFYAVPVTTKRKSVISSVGPLWIEPAMHIVEQSLAGKFADGNVCLALLLLSLSFLIFVLLGSFGEFSHGYFSRGGLLTEDLFLFGVLRILHTWRICEGNAFISSEWRSSYLTITPKS